MRTRHPGLSIILKKLEQGAPLSDEELARLERSLQGSRAAARRPAECEAVGPSPVGTVERDSLLPGHASAEGVARFVARHLAETISFFRPVQDVAVSGIGIGTYRGAMDDETDARYADAVHAALAGGINLVDTSLNYRHQRSEQSVATGVERFITRNGGSRDEIVVCTKGGFLVPGAISPDTLTLEEVAGGIHSLAPAFLADQIERSRRNLGLETIDVYYLHNPETQLDFVGEPEFMGRIRAAFEQLEQAVAAGFIRYYGTATWQGYWDGALSLPALVGAAREVAGADHHFRFVQMPFHLGLREPGPRTGNGGLLELFSDLGMTVIASASLWQGRLVEDLPEEIAGGLPRLTSDSQRAIQFTRSAPGVSAALVGMRDPEHVRENLGVARVPPLSPAEYRRLAALLV
jgi:aryl-alcohol dehydrogenase-like predicted oxidoreductase